MNETTKKVLLIGVIVVAVVLAGFGAMRAFGGEQEEIVQTLPGDPNFKSEKQQAIEAQTAGKTPDVGGEKDLSGALGG